MVQHFQHAVHDDDHDWVTRHARQDAVEFQVHLGTPIEISLRGRLLRLGDIAAKFLQVGRRCTQAGLADDDGLEPIRASVNWAGWIAPTWNMSIRPVDIAPPLASVMKAPPVAPFAGAPARRAPASAALRERCCGRRRTARTVRARMAGDCPPSGGHAPVQRESAPQFPRKRASSGLARISAAQAWWMLVSSKGWARRPYYVLAKVPMAQ